MKDASASTLSMGHPLYRLALIPPTLRCPFRPPIPLSPASSRKTCSRLSSASLHVTFIIDLQPESACGLQKSLESSMSYRTPDFSLFLPMAPSSPPFLSTQARTLSRTKIPNVLGVLNIDPFEMCV